MNDDFAGALARICSKESAAARRDPERWAEMIERLSAALGLTIALAANCDPAKIDELMTGAEAFAHQEAVQKASVLRRFVA